MIRCLTVQQPWAWAIIHGQKRCENRAWPTKYRGPLLIHAGKSRDAVDEYNTDHVGLDDDDKLAFGAIIGIVDLVDCVELANVGPEHDDYATGPWCWILANPRPVEVTACKGALGLWEYRGEMPTEVVS